MVLRMTCQYLPILGPPVSVSRDMSCCIWVAAVYLMLTGLNGVASTKLARNLGICQKSLWYLGHRIRAAFANDQDRLMLGPFEIDETYIGGKAKNQHAS